MFEKVNSFDVELLLMLEKENSFDIDMNIRCHGLERLKICQYFVYQSDDMDF